MSESHSSGIRLAIVLSHPTQYYSPWFRFIVKNTALNVRVFYLWDFGVTSQTDPQFGRKITWDVDLLSGYDHEFVPNAAKHPGAENFWGFNNPQLSTRLSAWRPDAILIFGYKWASHLRAVVWARSARVPILFRGDSHLIGRNSAPLAKRILLGALFSRIAAFLYVGEANRDYFLKFGVPKAKLFFAPHSVDSTLFDAQNAAYATEAASLKARIGLRPDSRVILFAGKLVAAKQPQELLAAFIGEDLPGTALVFVGEGPEKERLEEVAGASAVRDRIKFLPFANQTEMPSRYCLAELFVLPSKGIYETWGLAVNEAMLMATPCLVSTRVGCQRDLVQDGVTGWSFDTDVPGELGRKLKMAMDTLSTATERARIRSNAKDRVSGYSFARTTAGLQEALESLPADFPR